jgi:hypothetical protein
VHHLLQIWFDWVLHGGYLGIIVLMALESSIFPVPSEIVIPPAAFLAGQGKLNLWGVIAAFMAWRIRYLLGITLAWTDPDRKVGPLFRDQRIKAGASGTLAASLRSRRNFLCAAAACDSASHFHSSRNHSNEFYHLQLDDDRRFGPVVRRAGLVWSNSNHA